MSHAATASIDPNLRQRIAIALAILRVTLGLFLLVWGLEKFIIPDRSIEIYGYFYGLSASAAVTYVLGALESVLALAIVIGAFRRWSYGIGLLIHAVTTIVTLRLILDPWGLISGEPQHLFVAAVPLLAAFLALYLLRELDTYSFDARRSGS